MKTVKAEPRSFWVCACLVFCVSQQAAAVGDVIWSISAKVSQDTLRHIYTYSYSVSNSAQSSNAIDQFGVDITQPANSIVYDSVGLGWADTVTQNRLNRNYRSLYSKVVTTSISASPKNWDGDLTNSNILTWFTTVGSLLNVNNQISGFSGESKGLPGIRQAFAMGYLDYTNVPDMDLLSEGGADSLMDALDSLRIALTNWTTTVGPTSPPLIFQPLAFADTLISYVTRSRTFGWIESQTIADKYSGYFGHIKNDITTFDLKTARVLVDTILQQVDADSPSSLTPEAYVLIRYNTEYFREQLQAITRK